MPRIAVVGATGAVGRELLTLISRSEAASTTIVPIASARSAGTDLGAQLGLGSGIEPVRTLDDVDFGDVSVTFFAAGVEVSRQAAEKVAKAGSLVIDNSSAFRLRDDVPLVVPQVNPASLAHRPPVNLIANPNCSTIQLVRALAPLHELAGLRRVILTTYQAASGGGIQGLAELARDSRRLLDGADTLASGRFGPPLAFDLVPQIGGLNEHGSAHEEEKLGREPGKIMGLTDLPVSVTAVRAPIFHCHAEAVWVELGRQVPIAEAEEALAGTPGIRFYKSGDDPPYPTPRLVENSGAEGRALVHVGRVRADTADPRALWLWIVADNLWVGAALNAFDIMRTAQGYGWLDR
ncbi:aspartate-semialdehyde dehydrogenase [Sphaerisporangium corydalis]|uniref:Aspartate-semialdehyde dehydrogenase n=1 Tax=Sphaerisporangium corydalis TaxID=1441875 RepID=A0ABV9ENX2_9ACTN|nr:aspartate-semialdehyde dehydrogenase [Sphaerisporangium corydalis]